MVWLTRLWTTHRRITLLGLVALTLVALLGLAHAPFVRARVLAVAVDALRAEGVRADIGRLDYNLLTLRVSIDRATFTADGHDAPFFAVDRFSINLPWSVVRGPLAIEALDIIHPVITIARSADGRLNLPEIPTSDEPFVAMQVGRLLVSDLAIGYGDRPIELSVDGRAVTLDMTTSGGGPLAGRLTMTGGVSLAYGDRRTAITRLDGGFRFDGSAVTIEALTLEAPEARVQIDGVVDLLVAAPRVDARYQGRVALDRVAPWIAPGEALSGAVDFSGTAAGPLDAPDVTLTASGRDLAWRDQRGIAVDMSSALSGTAATIDRVRVAFDSGAIDGRARVALADGERSSAEFTWTDLDVGSLARSAGADQPRLATRASGRATAAWTGADVATASAHVRLVLQTAQGGRSALPVSGRLTAALDGGRWTMKVDGLATRTLALDADLGGRLDAGNLAASTLTGRLRGGVVDVNALLAELGGAGIEVPDESAITQGRAALDLTLAGTFDSPSARGSVEALGLDMRGGVALDGSTQRLRGDLAVDVPRLAPLVALVAPDTPVEGSATLRVDISGTTASPRVGLVAQALAIAVAGQRVDSVDASATLAGQTLEIDRLDITQAGGRLQATGRYALDTGRFTIDAKGRGLSVAPIVSAGEAAGAPLPVSAVFDVDLKGEGTLDDPRGAAALAVRDLVWDGQPFGEARLDATLGADGARVNGRLPIFDATLDARAALQPPRTFAADVIVGRADLGTLPLPLTGIVTASAKASGDLDRPGDATVDVDLRLVDVRAAGAPLLLERPARLRYAAGRVVVDDLSLRFGGSTLTASGGFGDAADREGLTAHLKGDAADFLPFARLVEGLEDVTASGAVDVTVLAAGALDAPTIAATLALSGASAAMPDLPAIDNGRLRASFADGLLTISELAATWQGATLSGTATAPVTLLGAAVPEGYLRGLPALPDRARAAIRADGITRSLAAPFVEPGMLDQIAVAAAVAVDVEATSLELDGIRADVTFERADLTLAGVPLQQDRPTRLRLADGRFDVVDWTWSGAGNQLTVTGGASLAGDTAEVDATLAGSLDLRMLAAVSRDLGAGGRADFDIRARGPIEDPAVTGEITLRDGELAIRDPRLAVSELNGVVTLTPNLVRLVDLRANANGGTLRMTGDVQLRELAPVGGSIVLTGRELALEAPENLRSEVNLDLTFTVSDTAPELTGTVTVLRGSYRSPISLTGQLLTGGVEVVPAVAAEPTLVDRIRLSVNVVSADGIAVDNNYGRLEIGTDLKVVGTAALPALAGRLTVGEGGAVFLAGQTWTVERGTVDFTSATTIEPVIDLSLSTRVQRFEVRLTVSGTPDTLEANLSSPGGLSQADAVSLLLTGQLAEDQTMAQTDIARGQLLLLLSGELLGFAGRAVGLDSAQVGRGLGGAASDFDLITNDTDPSARLTVSKQLRRDVELVFSQNLRDTTDLTWIAIYRPIRAVEVRGTSSGGDTRSYEFRHELNFGGRGPARPVDASRPSARVTTVRWTGSPGFDEAELRGRITLREGDRFDFYRWQQDRDRLAAFYRSRGFFEARIRATRDGGPADDGEPAIALAYEIERGPSTSLVLEGAPLPGSAVRDMEDTWARSLFDGFLQEDIEAIARTALARDGHLEGTAAVRIEEDEAAGTKRIVVLVSPGPRYSDRRLVFDGQSHLSADDLEDVIEERRLTLAAWLRPAEVESAVAAHYRTLGFQSARVTAADPAFSGDTATRTFTVSEGPRFRVADVTITGVEARPVDEVRKAFGVEAGAPYVPASLEPARRAVELGYLRLGYNHARVSVTSVAVADEPAARLIVDVDEGRQQVLREIAIEGAGITSEGTVRRALDLQTGEPADQSDLFRAQKRLYDTGAFRRADVDLQPIEGAATDDVEPVRAVVSLEEVRPYRFRYGVRLTDDTGPLGEGREIRPGVVADLLRRNLFGRAISAGLAGQAERDRRLARGILSVPRLFGLPVTSSLFLTRSRQDFTPEGATPFVEDGSEITAEQRFRPHKAMAVSYDYRFRRSHIFEPDPATSVLGLPPLDVLNNIARLTGTFVWDTRDDPFNSRRGWFRSIGVEYAAAALGSDLRFVKYVMQQFYFQPVGQGVVLASAVRVGASNDFGEGLLPSERFFVGGNTSVRGFAEDGLGAADFLGDPVGGNSSLILNQEIRFPIYKWVRGVGFVDAGNVFKRSRDMSLTDLEAGAGFGLRIDTPFGLARIDYGMPLTRRGLEPFGRWYFSLGQAF